MDLCWLVQFNKSWNQVVQVPKVALPFNIVCYSRFFAFPCKFYNPLVNFCSPWEALGDFYYICIKSVDHHLRIIDICSILSLPTYEHDIVTICLVVFGVQVLTHTSLNLFPSILGYCCKWYFPLQFLAVYFWYMEI